MNKHEAIDIVPLYSWNLLSSIVRPVIENPCNAMISVPNLTVFPSPRYYRHFCLHYHGFTAVITVLPLSRSPWSSLNRTQQEAQMWQRNRATPIFRSDKLWFPSRQISWVSDWAIEWLIQYAIFLSGLARQRRARQKRNLAQE